MVHRRTRRRDRPRVASAVHPRALAPACCQRTRRPGRMHDGIRTFAVGMGLFPCRVWGGHDVPDRQLGDAYGTPKESRPGSRGQRHGRVGNRLGRKQAACVAQRRPARSQHRHKWTGVLLATPALVPVLVLIALAVVVVAMRKWKPLEGRWRARFLDTWANFPWIRRAEELLITAPLAEIIEDTPISTRSGADDSKEPSSHNWFWGNGGPYLDYVPSGLRGAGRPPQRRAWRKPWSNTTPVRLPSTATSTTTSPSAHSCGGITVGATT
jgi:hypothetical protein